LEIHFGQNHAGMKRLTVGIRATHHSLDYMGNFLDRMRFRLGVTQLLLSGANIRVRKRAKRET
jgi:hypothetical protein